MTRRSRLARQATAWLLLAVAAPALAVELRLDGVTAMAASGEVPLRVDGRARFFYDPDSGALTSSGSWTAQYVFGPNQLTRFSHKLEDFAARADGSVSARSYECVEGTFAAVIAASSCGNYRFGPNGIDEGGLGDDVVVGPPRSLDGFRVSARTWDGETLLLIIGPEAPPAAVFPEYSLALRLTRVGRQGGPPPAAPRAMR